MTVTIRYNFVDVLVNLSAEIVPSNKADVKAVNDVVLFSIRAVWTLEYL